MLGSAPHMESILQALPELLSPATCMSVLVSLKKWYPKKEPLMLLQSDPGIIRRAQRWVWGVRCGVMGGVRVGLGCMATTPKAAPGICGTWCNDVCGCVRLSVCLWGMSRWCSMVHTRTGMHSSALSSIHAWAHTCYKPQPTHTCMRACPPPPKTTASGCNLCQHALPHGTVAILATVMHHTLQPCKQSFPTFST